MFFGLFEEYKTGPTVGLINCELDFSKFNQKAIMDRSNMRLVVREFLFDPKKGMDVAFSVFLGILAIISVLLMMAESVDRISKDYNTYFRVAESIVTGIFTIEWCLGW